MIRHAQAALCPVDPLPVPVIEPSFRAVLVSPVGKPHLLASHPAAALLPAVHLPPIAGAADVKHHPATRPSAKQLDPCHFAGHTPHDSIAACEPCRVGGDAGDIDLELGDVTEWAERIERKYERGECSLAAQTDRITRGHHRAGQGQLGVPLFCPRKKGQNIESGA